MSIGHTCLNLFFFRSSKDNAGGTYGKERAVFDSATFTWFQFHVVNERARITVVVGECIADVALLVVFDMDGTMVQIHTGIDSFKWCIDGVALLVSADHVIA